MSTGVLANGELMQTYADKFMDIYCKDKNSRYRSYDYIHSFYLAKRSDNRNKTLDKVALRLFAFLGSWGMPRRISHAKGLSFFDSSHKDLK